MAGAAFQPRSEPLQGEPLEAIRAGFEAGAVQTVFLALSDLPDTLPDGILTEEEEARAQRLAVALVRRGFIGGRWLLRAILAALAGVEPRSLELRAGKHGKLFLADHERLAASFNLSHSGDLAAFALMRARRIGIDIEAERPLTDAVLLARRILGPRECALFEALPETARGAALLAAWTRKEAVLKAIGMGISGGLTSIEVLPGVNAGDYVARYAAEPSVGWSVRTLSTPTGFQGAIAIEAEAPRLIAWQAMPQRARSA